MSSRSYLHLDLSHNWNAQDVVPQNTLRGVTLAVQAAGLLSTRAGGPAHEESGGAADAGAAHQHHRTAPVRNDRRQPRRVARRPGAAPNPVPMTYIPSQLHIAHIPPLLR